MVFWVCLDNLVLGFRYFGFRVWIGCLLIVVLQCYVRVLLVRLFELPVLFSSLVWAWYLLGYFMYGLFI